MLLMSWNFYHNKMFIDFVFDLLCPSFSALKLSVLSFVKVTALNAIIWSWTAQRWFPKWRKINQRRKLMWYPQHSWRKETVLGYGDKNNIPEIVLQLYAFKDHLWVVFLNIVPTANYRRWDWFHKRLASQVIKKIKWMLRLRWSPSANRDKAWWLLKGIVITLIIFFDMPKSSSYCL